MRILGVFVLIVALVAGVGLYRGWFRVGADTATTSSEYTLTVDKDQIRDDKDAAAAKVGDLGHDAKEAVSSDDDDSLDIDDRTTAVKVGVNDNDAIYHQSAQGGNSHDGVLVSMGDTLKMTDQENNEHQHSVAANVKITRDGEVCTAAALSPGMRIRVTTQSAVPHMVTRIEALEHSDAFERAS